MNKRRNTKRSAGEVDRHVGKRLRQRRLILGLTMEHLARHVGVGYQQIHKYEMGASKMSGEQLHVLADVLGVSPSYFFQGLKAPRRGRGLKAAGVGGAAEADGLLREETLELMRAYHRLTKRQRRGFLALAKALGE